jgi:hypothetical protein
MVLGAIWGSTSTTTLDANNNPTTTSNKASGDQIVTGGAIAAGAGAALATVGLVMMLRNLSTDVKQTIPSAARLPPVFLPGFVATRERPLGPSVVSVPVVTLQF